MSDKNKIRVAVSGYFDPIHVGHLEYLKMAKELGDSLVVIVNNNHQCKLKKGKPFMDQNDRLEIVKALRFVDEVFLSIDKDRTVCATIEKIVNEYGNEYELAFANGGDQNNDTIPEKPICEKLNVHLIDGLGDKIQSSSWLLGK